MATEQVDEYTRVVNGKTVRVKAHNRLNDEAATAVLKAPGRPSIAAAPGTFGNNRSIPGIWPQDLQKEVAVPPPPQAAEKKIPQEKDRTSEKTADTIKTVRKKFSSDAAETKAQKAEEDKFLASVMSAQKAEEDKFLASVT